MEQNKNKKKVFDPTYSLIVISSGRLCQKNVEHIEENQSRYTKMIIYSNKLIPEKSLKT